MRKCEGSGLSLSSAEQTHTQTPKGCSSRFLPPATIWPVRSPFSYWLIYVLSGASVPGLSGCLTWLLPIQKQKAPPLTHFFFPFLLPPLNPLALWPVLFLWSFFILLCHSLWHGWPFSVMSLTGTSGSPGAKRVMEQERADSPKEISMSFFFFLAYILTLCWKSAWLLLRWVPYKTFHAITLLLGFPGSRNRRNRGKKFTCNILV